MRIYLFIILTLLAVAGFSFPALAQETITIVADEWCPYNCGEKDTKPGYVVEIARQALKKSNINVVYKVMPWFKAVELTREGKYDAIVGANRGDAPDFIFPEIVQGISINQVWVKNSSDWTYKEISSLDGLRIGIVAGYSYGKKIDPYLKKRQQDGGNLIRVISANKATEYNISELLSDRIDVLLEDKSVIDYYFASQNKPTLIKAVGNPVDINDYDDTYIFVAFSPNKEKSAHYAKLLTEGMREMRQTGELKAILASYNMDDAYRFLGKASDH